MTRPTPIAKPSLPALPPMLEAIRDRIGDRIILKFIAEFGGLEYYLPTLDRIDGDHPLARAVGLPAARRICEMFGGSVHEIPCADVELAAYWARRYRADGLSYNDIVIALRRRHGIRRSYSTVRSLTKHIQVPTDRRARRRGKPGSDALPALPLFETARITAPRAPRR
jgi:hypothetical protein